MTLWALLLLVGTSLAWAGLDLSRKLLTDAMRPVPMVTVLTAGQLVVMAVWLLVEGRPTIEPGYWLPAAGSVGLNLVSNVMAVRALALSPLSVTIPFLSLTPVFATALSALILGEMPEVPHLAGILLVLAGAVSLAMTESRAATFRALLQGLRRERGSWRMIGVALMWSTAGPLDKLATAQASAPFHGIMIASGVVIGLVGVLAYERRLHELKGWHCHPLALMGGMVAGGVGLVLQLMAMQQVFVNLVEGFKRVTSLAAAALFGRLLFREDVTRERLLAIALMACGVVLLTL